MIRASRIPGRLAALALNLPLMLPLGGCISFGPKPPPTLLGLEAAQPAPSGQPRRADDRSAIAVAVPAANPALNTQRVMVRAQANQIAYIKGALWAAAPAQLFRNLLAETITTRTGRLVPDTKLLGIQPDSRLAGTLVEFGLDGPGNAAVVTYEAVLLRSGTTTARAQRFTARVPVQRQDGPAVGAALDQAANQVAGEVAAWVSSG